MRENTQLRWITEAEARCFRDFALMQRAASEPYPTLCPAAPARPGSTGYA